LKAVLVRVSNSRFVQVIIFNKYLDFWLVQIFAVGA
jgi:hypothetical protein